MKRLLIANRGEIAVRIIRAAKELGMTTILAHSSADKSSLAAMLADECVEIGPAAAAKSYLNVPVILQAALDVRADAIHPGYGFLAENAHFARQVQAAGMIFVGPDADTIDMMGDKAQARATAIAAGVPVVPGSEGVLTDMATALLAAQEVGFPLMIKASAGGGGKGIRIVEDPEDFAKEFEAAQREGLGAFGDNAMYLERFISQARHIEVQVLGDGESVVHLFDRECSLQRRRQKILEEAPSPALDDATRSKICESAVALAQSVNYKGAGTMEYLFDDRSGEFFFIEMNTRIQVEHPITEMITGVDLIREMLLIAFGDQLKLKQEDIHIKGAAIECRINAEDPANNFQPNIGTIQKLTWATGPGVRIDSMLYEGYGVSPFYDSMLAKVIVWDNTRADALKRMKRVLAECEIEGLKTTLPLHQMLVDDADVHASQFHTNWLEHWLHHQYSASPSSL
ncbi:acetyl-CoA carboxylase biotin carboxylase subunit [Vitreoscilla massiliensis]|uniref:biotin carboxylase n=2 Tax=Vitreoscilla massiliensis TaxID=1689272 RepID=A0ABY4E2H6_9NEIS|nr:acetyl-CoA carboxylase biotin carboxylase subunit [Vitreoscilla massiliensis]UOO89732.1 acetyl-CoA carboxylase biotin carboxylase subunit [Vitreoscilla massiliensis]